jgi:hypothetical protein
MYAARNMRAQHHLDGCLGPEEERVPFRTAGKDGQAFSVDRHLRRDPKKPAPSLL